ncbi:MAG TPA: 2-oxoacid:acceptor oxidoreductase family protein [Anaeromyxobacteraceae bacterium]
MSAFYETFERHDHAEGLKGRTTHYCPGCGHGLVHRYLAQAVEALGIQDRTVAISPVGCAVFLYYYLDVGHTQAAHGRAPAVAIGHKLANPDAVVVSYQGDGDLASIGLAEIIHAAQLGIPITVVFVNNAVYGMTGGQLAPTTLMGQRTTTSPHGRDPRMGHPLRMAELVAQLEAPVYVERVALFDARQRTRAARAIEKALRLQVERRGFAFVEVLAECPTHLRLSPVEAEQWVKREMVPVFPLGVKKDRTDAAWPAWPEPIFDPAAVLDAFGTRADPTSARGGAFPRGAFGEEVGIKLAGAGGDGAQTAALLLARAAVNEGFDATHIPSYGPESRGGTSYADVRLAVREVLSPDVPAPHILVAFNVPSLARFGPSVVEGGTIVYDSSLIRERPAVREGVRWVGVPCSALAAEIGEPRTKNVVALGALQAATGLLPAEALVAALRDALRHKGALAAMNEEAFARGVRAVRPIPA